MTALETLPVSFAYLGTGGGRTHEMRPVLKVVLGYSDKWPQEEPPEEPQQIQIGPRRRMRKRAPFLRTFISASCSLAEYPKRPSQMI